MALLRFTIILMMNKRDLMKSKYLINLLIYLGGKNCFFYSVCNLNLRSSHVYTAAGFCEIIIDPKLQSRFSLHFSTCDGADCEKL